MSDVLSAPIGAVDTHVDPPAITTDKPLTVREAAQALSEQRWKAAKAAAEPPKQESPPPAAPEQAAAEAPIQDAAPEEAPGDTTEQQAEPAEMPPIDPPRSWTKEEKEEFRTYPREAQEKIARREQDRETALRRSQNEAAEKAKAIDAERQRAEQARLQYEQALPQLVQALRSVQAGQFSDIKTQEDVNKLAAEDWPRFAKWQAHMMQVASLEQEAKQAQERQHTEAKEQWAKFAESEDKLLLDKVPELADKERSSKVGDAALSVLEDVGFSKTDLAKAWNGEMGISVRDHRIQQLIYDAVRYREAKAKIAQPQAKPVPPVQKPGVSQQKGDTNLAKIDSLKKRLTTAKGMEAVRIATELHQAQRAARG